MSPYPTCLQIHFNIILQSTASSCKLSRSLRCPHQKPVCTFPVPPYMPHVPPTSFFLIWSTRIFGEEYGSYRYILCSIIYVTKIHILLFPTFTQKIIRFGNYSASEDGDVPRNYMGADKSLARPWRKQANVSVRMAWIFSALALQQKKKLDDSSCLDVVEIARVPDMFPSLFPFWSG